ncbi:MAG: type IV secretory system conjugative DNA transfer family protein, partial [Hyphomicrobiales bacterium]|nr:type IV secretory system conjugative DNA transfer family protein [Hyphomicrobiales bacterium]
LLSYPGSVFVLDVKGELWEATAGYRAQQYGPVLRFSPTDDDGRSHGYNPFDAIPSDPRKAGPACQVLVNQIIPEPVHSSDPYWEEKARSFLWGFAMLVALEEKGETRNLSKIVEYLNLPLDYEGREKAIKTSPAYRLAFKLKQASFEYSLPELDSLGTALEDGLTGQRLSSVFDVARSRLSGLVRSTTAAEALSVSHWTPRDLRERPGMSIYLSFKPGEIGAFAGIIRLIFQQHVDMLTREFRHGALKHPITFFLDELPQLGYMPSLNAMLDVGRGAGLRLWMFAQFLGQLREIYHQRADGIVGATQIRCFQQPDNEAAHMLSGMLGRTRSLLDGEQKPLAYPHELAGREHGDKVVVVARGEHPCLLETRKAYTYLSREMSVPPPVVPTVADT